MRATGEPRACCVTSLMPLTFATTWVIAIAAGSGRGGRGGGGRGGGGGPGGLRSGQTGSWESFPGSDSVSSSSRVATLIAWASTYAWASPRHSRREWTPRLWNAASSASFSWLSSHQQLLTHPHRTRISTYDAHIEFPTVARIKLRLREADVAVFASALGPATDCSDQVDVVGGRGAEAALFEVCDFRNKVVKMLVQGFFRTVGLVAEMAPKSGEVRATHRTGEERGGGLEG